MTVDTPALPNNVEELHRLIRQLQVDHEGQVQSLQANLQAERNERIEYQNQALEYFEELQLMRRRLFGRSAERLSEADRKQLWLADRTRNKSGIRIFDVQNDDEITSGPIDVGLPPFAICFVPDRQ